MWAECSYLLCYMFEWSDFYEIIYASYLVGKSSTICSKFGYNMSTNYKYLTIIFMASTRYMGSIFLFPTACSNKNHGSFKFQKHLLKLRGKFGLQETFRLTHGQG